MRSAVGTQESWLTNSQFAQELLSTFSTSLGEVALRPSTGGVFIVEIVYEDITQSAGATIQRRLLWDRKAEGGFPETKELKRRVRDVIDPNRDLGHVDRDHTKPKAAATDVAMASTDNAAEGAGESSVSSSAPTQPRFPPPSELAARAPAPPTDGSGPSAPGVKQWGMDQDAHPAERRAAGSAGFAGIKPMVKKPPPESQRIIQERLDEGVRQQAQRAAEARGAGGHPGSTEATVEAAEDKAAKNTQDGQECEDCE